MSEAAKNRFLKLLALVRESDVNQAHKAVTEALRATPKDPNILHLAAQIAENRQEADRAITLYRRALQAMPNWFEAGMNLARVLSETSKTDEALDLLAKMTPHHLNRFEIFEAQALLSQKKGDLPSAAQFWRESLKRNATNPAAQGQYRFCLRQSCDWSNGDTPSTLLPPQTCVLFHDDPALQKKSAESFVQERFGRIKPIAPSASKSHPRKRIGYLSSDFHAHATSWLLAELFSLHDRERVEVYAYSYGIEDHSDIRARLRREADHFIELNALTPLQCAERIRADEIDILVDLKGHTHGARLDILAYRPAPVQLHWLGFPGTTGASFIDGFIGDAVTIPEGDEKYFTEKVLRLPHSYQINDRQKQVGPQLAKSAYGLPPDSLVLASFNQTYKITPEIFSIWCDVLQKVPKAVLWLFESNSHAPDNLRREAIRCGIDPSRLFFAKPTPLPDHLARYHVVDLALDTFPVGGHTTTSDALWVGAPVVTMAGQSFVSRVASSLLTAAELPQLITTNREEYKKLILELAQDDEKRNTLRAHLTTKKLSLPLFDTPRFVKGFEALLLKEF